MATKFGGGVEVKGMRALDRNLGIFDKNARKELRKQLKAIAEPIAVDVRHGVERFGARTVEGVQAGARTGMAVVRQRAKKTTGLRPDFGTLQMDVAFLPALKKNEPAAIRSIEDMLENLASIFNSSA